MERLPSETKTIKEGPEEKPVINRTIQIHNLNLFSCARAAADTTNLGEQQDDVSQETLTALFHSRNRLIIITNVVQVNHYFARHFCRKTVSSDSMVPTLLLLKVFVNYLCGLKKKRKTKTDLRGDRRNF